MYARERQRAEDLRARQPHAAQVLTLYLALLEVWEEPAKDASITWAAEHLLPKVVQATAEHGPEPLARAVSSLNGGAAELLAAWLAGDELEPAERYLARASMRGPLEATRHPLSASSRPDRCPCCGGPPQLSYRSDSDDPLVSGRRMLQCARCAGTWAFSATLCAACGSGGKRIVYAETRPGPQVGREGWERVRKGAPPRPVSTYDALFPHVRAEACETCKRYLIDVDLGRDPRAVPEVDELAALPLDLHLAEQGLSKITPNLMGF